MLFSASSREAHLHLSRTGRWTLAGALAALFYAGCSPTSPSAGETGDADGDWVLDSLGTTYDRNGDGLPDGFDIDGDGIDDGVGVDTNGDGEFDAVAVDKDGDRLRETLVFPDGSEIKGETPGDGDGDMTGDGDSTIVVGSGGQSGGDGDKSDEPYCNDFATTFEPKIPTVFILLDHSDSMFKLDFWEPMKTGVLNVVQALQTEVRFGFGTYTGLPDACEGLTERAPLSLDNYDAIATAYEGVQEWGDNDKTETPTPLAIQQAIEVLAADETPGDKYLLLVTDGEPDFCEDNLLLCASDATVAALQVGFERGIRSLVFGIGNDDNIANPEIFNYFAQAGMGQEPDWVDGLEVSEYSAKLQSRCEEPAAAQVWRELREELGNAPPADSCGTNQPPEGNTECYLPAGNYSAAGGTAEAFMDADPAALAETILSQVEQLKSCRFEFNFEVTDASTGEIFVGDLNTPIPTDQWHMVEDAPENNVLELTGEACTRWQSPDVFDFFAGFPCEAIVEIIR